MFEEGDLKTQVLTQCINFGIVPFPAFGLGILFFENQPYMALGLVPTSGMTISWTGFAKGYQKDSKCGLKKHPSK